MEPVFVTMVGHQRIALSRLVRTNALAVEFALSLLSASAMPVTLDSIALCSCARTTALASAFAAMENACVPQEVTIKLTAPP